MTTAKDFYLLRTPILSLNILEEFNGLSHAQLNNKLKTIFTNPLLQEAIYIASPELYEEFQKWHQESLTDKKQINKLVLSLFKYLLRMCTRCTPYGLFAGCAIGYFDQITQIILAHPDQHKKHCRLDMNNVAELANMISQIPEVQSQLNYYPNNSLYKIGSKFRYTEFAIKNKFRTYHLAEVASSDYLEKIISTANNGVTLSALTKCIVSNTISEDDATEFVTELVQNQILVSELGPTVTGEEFFTKLIKKLHPLESTADIPEKLTHIHQLLQDQTTGINKYLQTHIMIKELLPETNSKDLVQTDLLLSTPYNTISSTVVTDIQQQIEKLWSLSRKNDNTDLKSFCSRFKERYGEEEMPLLIALDAEAGIGYAGYSGGHTDHNPLIDDVIADNSIASNTIAWNKINEFQLSRLHACLRAKEVEIELTDKDLDELKELTPSNIPDSTYLMGSLLGKSSAAIDSGDYQFELNACGGPSAANLLGRFCHGDNALTARVKECLKEEEQCNPDFIYAEVVHLPEARTGNVLLRPKLRDYEIVYLGNGSVALDHQIPLSDLMVSVHNNTVILRSKKLNKNIIPRLSTAHNFTSGSLPTYKFLCDLQFQQMNSAIEWQWGIIGNEPFLPRVRYGKIILGKCTWVLHKKDYPELIQKKESVDIDYCELFKKTQSQLQLPQYIVIVEGDNELLINMHNESCLCILANTLIKKERIVLREFLNTADKCFIKGDQGLYTNQIIVPFKKTANINLRDLSNMQALKVDKQSKDLTTNDRIFNTNKGVPERSFITGSEWLYVKIYSGTNSSEKILKEVIKPLTETLVAENKIDKWFFIRYADPDSHIRIRFHHAEDAGFWKVVLERLHAVMKNNSDKALAYKIQTDTYEREIERYGMNTIELCEDVFCYDSEAAINCIDLLEGEEGEKYRWLLGVRGIDMLLNDFEYDLATKSVLLKKLWQGMFTEFGAGKILNNQLNDKYRVHMQLVHSILDEAMDAENAIEEAVAILTMRSIKLKEVVKKIRFLQVSDHMTTGFDELLPGYIHMFLNRMFLSNQRKHELVIYHFLSKYYESQIAINKKQLQNVKHGV